MTITKIRQTKQFKKSFQKLNFKERLVFRKKLELLLKDEASPQLRVHQLKRDLEEYKAFSIKYDLRCVYLVDGDVLVLINIGTHSKVY